jgi:hypothetical protein
LVALFIVINGRLEELGLSLQGTGRIQGAFVEGKISPGSIMALVVSLLFILLALFNFTKMGKYQLKQQVDLGEHE